jgi:Ca2+-binding EF-hand superfamily protein
MLKPNHCTGNGYITTTVLREILKELDDKLTAEDLDLMIEEIDSDGSGTVDFDGKLHCLREMLRSLSDTFY